MAPSFPADTTETIEMSSKPTTTPNASSFPDSNGSEPTLLTSLQEGIEDIRDIIVETDFYHNNERRLKAISNTASSFFQYSKQIAWVVGTSTLVLVIPLLYEIDKELGPGYEAPPGSLGVSDASSQAASTSTGADSAASTTQTSGT